MVTEKTIMRDFEWLKKNATVCLQEKDIENSIESLITACTLAKTYYLSYTDQEIEAVCEKIADYLNENYIKYHQDNSIDGIVYYDFFGMDNVALTRQYLSAISNWGQRVLFISPHKLENNKSSHIIDIINKNRNVQYYYLDVNRKRVDVIADLVNSVIKFNPKYSFIHTSTDDVVGIVSWYMLNGIERFFVEGMDHTFWVGTKRFEHYIMFRDYGFNVATDYRYIPSDKILVQPFYPCYEVTEFNGIDNFTPEKVNMISGGRLIKTYSKGDKFFHLVRRILEENPRATFYYIGGGYVGENGQTKHTRSLIKKYGLEDRYFLLGFRQDISAVLEHMNIYIGTWPMCGGQMTQMAAMARLPILQYSENGMGSSADDFLISTPGKPKIVFNNEADEFYKKAKMLVNNKSLREEEGKALKKCVLDPKTFEDQLKRLVITKKNITIPRRFNVDIVPWRVNRIETENKCEHLYYPIIANSLVIRKQRVLKYIINIILLFFYSDKKWLLNKLRKKLRKK